jgi:hypothetical protein
MGVKLVRVVNIGRKIFHQLLVGRFFANFCIFTLKFYQKAIKGKNNLYLPISTAIPLQSNLTEFTVFG